MSLFRKFTSLFLIAFFVSGCHVSDEKAPATFLHLTSDNINGKLIRAIDIREMKYNGRGMQLQVHYFGDLPLNSEAEQSAVIGKHVDLTEISTTVDLTRDQWKPVFEAWFHKAASIPESQSLHPTAVFVNKQQIWQYTAATASSGTVSRYIRAYLIPECKHAIVINSRGWTSTDSTSYNPYLDDLATCVDINESP